MEPSCPVLEKSVEEIFKDGYKLSSAEEDAAIISIQGVSYLSELARTAFGPHCRNTFLINNIGLMPLTHSGRATTNQMDSAVRSVVNSSQLQQLQVCDGTKTVIILACGFLKQAENLLIMGLHPSEIGRDFELACSKALKELETLSTMTLPTPLTIPALTRALKPVFAAKQFGSENILATLVAEAALAIMTTQEKEFCADNIRVVKIVGGSLSGSKVVRGMVLRESEGTIKHITAAKVAVFTCALDIAQTETEGSALIKNADKTTSRKEKHLAKIIKEIAASGITVIIAGSSVSDQALQYLNRHSIAVLKVLSKLELRCICRVVNATPLQRIRTPTPEEVGWIDIYKTVKFNGDRMTVLRQLVAGDPGFEKSGKRGDGKGDKTPTATIVLRGSTANDLDELESAIDDGMSLIRLLLEDRRLVPGAGATELELARRMDVYGGKMKGHQRHVVKAFAAALEVIPRTLAENAAVVGRDGNKVVNRRLGEDEVTEPSDGDIEAKPPSDGTIIADSNSLPNPILDSLAVKRSAIKLAMEAAVSVLDISSVMRRDVGQEARYRLTIDFNFETTPIGTLRTILLSTLAFTIGVFFRDIYNMCRRGFHQ